MGWATRSRPIALYGLRVAASVTLALLTAYYLELDEPFWAGTSASIVCQPVVGSALRKGLFRMLGTTTGTTVSVVTWGLFPQDRVGFLVAMGFWTAACSFGNSIQKNFSAYGFALAGYTVAIVAVDAVPSPQDAFQLSLARATEIVIGIVSATLVMGLTDIGRSHESLAKSLDGIGSDILAAFSDLLRDLCGAATGGYERRRSLIARVAALDPLIDQAMGERPELSRRATVLRGAVAGLFSALSGWRIAEDRPSLLSEKDARKQAGPIAVRLPATWRERGPEGEPGDHPGVGRDAARSLAELDLEQDVSRLVLVEAAARVVMGLASAANGYALLTDPERARDVPRPFRASVPDYLPAVLNAVRTFVAVEAAVVFWVLTEWPTGMTAVTWVTITVMLFAAHQEKAVKAAFAFSLGSLLTACLGALCAFALLPNREGPVEFTLVIGGFMAPIAALSASPRFAPYFVATTINFVPMVAPTNLMTFDTASYYNNALAIVVGCLGGCLALVLIPPVPRAVRAERLVDLSSRDLRSLASARWSPGVDAWQERLYTRLIAMPPRGDLRDHGRLVAILSLGLQVLRLRALAGPDRVGGMIRTSLARLASNDVSGMLLGLEEIRDSIRESVPSPLDLRIAASIQTIGDILRHRHRPD